MVLPRAWSLHSRPDLEEQWMAAGAPPEMWGLMMEAFAQCPGFQPRPPVPMRSARFNNCYVMRSDIFDRYMTSLFEAIERLRDVMAGKPLFSFHRIWGYVGERR